MNKAIIALILTAPMFASAASFDCTKAGAPIEKRICNNPALDMMDTIQSNLYKAARAIDPSQQQVQRDWNRNVRVASKTDEELVVLYRARNAELMAVVNGEPVKPGQPVQQTRPAPVEEKPVAVQMPEPVPAETPKEMDFLQQIAHDNKTTEKLVEGVLSLHVAEFCYRKPVGAEYSNAHYDMQHDIKRLIRALPEYNEAAAIGVYTALESMVQDMPMSVADCKELVKHKVMKSKFN